VPADQRGRHSNRANKIPLDVVARIDQHIKSFPRESSHYSLDAEAEKFLSAELSVRRMWILYLVKFEPLTQPDESDEGNADAAAQVEGAGDERQKPRVTYDYYLSRFRKYDLSFGVPAVDSCCRCDELKIQIKAAVDEDTADALRAERRAHLVEADRGYAMRLFDQKMAQECRAGDPDWECPTKEFCSWDASEFVCSDMAGVLSTPKVSANKAFYLRKLKTYCYSMFSGQAGQHSLGFWNEVTARTRITHTCSHAPRCVFSRLVEHSRRQGTHMQHMHTDHGQKRVQRSHYLRPSVLCGTENRINEAGLVGRQHDEPDAQFLAYAV
jgi:hypothetical protein